MFSVKLHKDAEGQYDVEGIDPLAGLTEAQVRDKAYRAGVIEIQGKIRGNVKVDTASAIHTYLSKTYPDVIVTDHVETESTSETALTRKLIKLKGKAWVEEQLASA